MKDNICTRGSDTVKMVTEASSKYFGLEKLEGAIHTQEQSTTNG